MAANSILLSNRPRLEPSRRSFTLHRGTSKAVAFSLGNRQLETGSKNLVALVWQAHGDKMIDHPPTVDNRHDMNFLEFRSWHCPNPILARYTENDTRKTA